MRASLKFSYKMIKNTLPTVLNYPSRVLLSTFLIVGLAQYSFLHTKVYNIFEMYLS